MEVASSKQNMVKASFTVMLAVLFSTGCATYPGHATYPYGEYYRPEVDTVLVISDPPGALVTVGARKMTTPGRLSLDPASDYELTITKEGYSSKNVFLDSNSRYRPEILSAIGGVPIVMPAATLYELTLNEKHSGSDGIVFEPARLSAKVVEDDPSADPAGSRTVDVQYWGYKLEVKLRPLQPRTVSLEAPAFVVQPHPSPPESPAKPEVGSGATPRTFEDRLRTLAKRRQKNVITEEQYHKARGNLILEDRLRTLTTLRDKDLLTNEQYDAARDDVFKRIGAIKKQLQALRDLRETNVISAEEYEVAVEKLFGEMTK